MKIRTKARAKLSAIIASIAIIMSLSLVTAPTANAAGYMRLQGNACAGGHIQTIIVVTSTESVYGTATGTGWSALLSNYDGNENVNFAIKCSNNVWYYPIVHVTGYASPRWLGWI